MWISNYTGEVYNSLWHAVTTIIKDAIRCKSCRTVRMLDICRYKPSK